MRENPHHPYRSAGEENALHRAELDPNHSREGFHPQAGAYEVQADYARQGGFGAEPFGVMPTAGEDTRARLGGWGAPAAGRRYTGGGKPPQGYRRSDQRILEDVCDEVMRHPEIDSSEVCVDVRDGEVILHGVVDYRHQKRALEDIAEAVLGVDDVDNRIRVRRSVYGLLRGEFFKTDDSANS